MPPDVAIQLTSVLIEIFGIMGIGFVAFRLHLLQAKDMKAFTWFSAKICLPVTLFAVTSTMSTDFNVSVIVLIFLVKFVVGGISYMIPLLVLNSTTRWLTAATFLSCIASSNDTAIGLALVLAVFPKYTSTMVSIITCYVGALAIHVFTWEYGAQKRDQLSRASPLSGMSPMNQRAICRKVFLNFLQNPLMVMALLGLVYRFVPPFKWTLVMDEKQRLQLPFGLKDLAVSIKGAFIPLAIFQLGEIVEQNTSVLTQPGNLLVPFLLSLMKLMVTPALLLLLAGPVTGATGDELEELQEFLIMYGFIPTTAKVAVFAKVYNFVTTDTSSVVLITHVASAPLMLFATVYLRQLSIPRWAEMMTNVGLVMNIASMGLLMFFFASFVLMRDKWLRFPMLLLLILAFVLFGLFLSVTIDPKCGKGTYVVRGFLLLSIDFLVLGLAIDKAAQGRRGIAFGKRLAPWLAGAALVLPALIILPNVKTWTPKEEGPLGTNCYKLMPGEEIINAVKSVICLFGSLFASSLSFLQELEEDTVLHKVTGVYVLVSIASTTWLLELAFDVSAPVGSGGRFLIFAATVGYNFLAIVMCLLPLLQGECLERWRTLCSKKSSMEEFEMPPDASRLIRQETSFLSFDIQ